MAAMFAPAASALLDASKSQLLLIDHQERLMPAIADAVAVLANTLRLAKLARELDVPVLGTEQVPHKLGPLGPELRALCGEVFAKHHFDACAGGLAEPVQRIASQGRPQLVVAGCETHVCLLQTALGLLAAGHDVWIVADASGSRTVANRDVALRRLERAGAVIVSTEMVGFEWLRHAEHPQFRLLQQLVR